MTLVSSIKRRSVKSRVDCLQARPDSGAKTDMATKFLSFIFGFLLLAGCSSTNSRSSINSTSEVSDQIPMKLMKPDGTAPFPAVVIMHDCSGLGPRSSGAPERWARKLLNRGYAVL